MKGLLGAGADVAREAELIRHEADVLREDLPDGAGAELLLFLHSPCLHTAHYYTNLEDIRN